MHLKYVNDPDLPGYGQCDLDFESGNELYDAAYLSLLCYARGRPDDSQNSKDRYGWWMDDLTSNSIGSKLWTLKRAKITNITIPLINQYLKDCLQWMIDDGICADLGIEVWQQGNVVKARIDIIRSNNNNVVLKFDDLWKMII